MTLRVIVAVVAADGPVEQDVAGPEYVVNSSRAGGARNGDVQLFSVLCMHMWANMIKYLNTV